MRRLKIALKLAVFLLIAHCALPVAEARIIIVPPEPPHLPMPRPVPPSVPQISVSEYSVETDIDRQVAHVRIKQVFKNDTNQQLEGTFIFPLPADAQVSNFTMIAEGKRMEGEILDKDEARRIYESIVRANRDPALLEYIDHKLFRARVYPIPPKAKRTLEFSYDQILKAENGLVEFFFPLGHEARELHLDRFVFTVNLKSDIPLKTIYSPTYDVNVTRRSETDARATLDMSKGALDQDFLLYYSRSAKDMDLTLLTHRQSGQDGFFTALVTPDPDFSAQKGLPKDFIFVLDTSGSMEGEKIAQARDALVYCLGALGAQDRFNIVNFESTVNSFYPKLMPASAANIGEAKRFAKSLQARGGTFIDGALQEAFGMIKNSERPAQIVFLTDGLPTVGEENAAVIAKNVKQRNRYEARLFTFGVGYDVNTLLLDMLAEQNHGASDYVRPGENIEVKVSRLYEKISKPVLTDVALKFGLPTYDVYPPVIGDMFAGGQVIVVGRYRRAGPVALTLTGESGGRVHSWTYETKFPEREWDNAYIPRLWASRKIGYLLDQIQMHGEKDELVKEVVKLSEQYGIITPYTSYFIQEERSLSRWDEDRSSQRSRVEDQVRSEAKRESGESAVAGSMAKNQLKQSAQNYGYKADSEALAAAPPAASQSYSGGRAFSQPAKPTEPAFKDTQQKLKQSTTRNYFFSDGYWVDNNHSKTNTLIRIKPFSEAYFELLKRKPELRTELSVGSQVIVALGKVSVQIDEKGQDKLLAKDWTLLESGK